MSGPHSLPISSTFCMSPPLVTITAGNELHSHTGVQDAGWVIKADFLLVEPKIAAAALRSVALVKKHINEAAF